MAGSWALEAGGARQPKDAGSCSESGECREGEEVGWQVTWCQATQGLCWSPSQKLPFPVALGGCCTFLRWAEFVLEISLVLERKGLGSAPSIWGCVLIGCKIGTKCSDTCTYGARFSFKSQYFLLYLPSIILKFFTPLMPASGTRPAEGPKLCQFHSQQKVVSWHFT